MTIGNALTFISRGQTDAALRNKLNRAETPSKVEKILEEEHLMFSSHDFDEAFHHQLTLCDEADQADKLREFKMWWDLITAITAQTENNSCDGMCNGCC